MVSHDIVRLEEVYKKDSSITFIVGRRGSGKTSLSLFLMEKGQTKGYWGDIAGNTATRNDPRLSYICYFDRLEDWLKQPGKKAYALDELGKHLYKMAFMSKKAQMILEVCQLIRKYDAHLFGCAPSPKLVNTLFFGTDLLDVLMYKVSKDRVRIKLLERNEIFTMKNVPDTSIRFITKDTARFEMHDPTRPSGVDVQIPRWEEAARLYLKYRNLRTVGNIMKVSHVMVKYWLDHAIQEPGYSVNK